MATTMKEGSTDLKPIPDGNGQKAPTLDPCVCCGDPISNYAKSCPRCGHPADWIEGNSHRARPLNFVLGGVFVILATADFCRAGVLGPKAPHDPLVLLILGSLAIGPPLYYAVHFF